MLALHKEMAWSISSPSQALQLGKESSAPSMWFNLVYQYRHIDYQYPWVHESSNTLLSLLDEHLDKKKNIPSAARILPPLRKAASDSPILIHCTNAQISSQRGPFKAGRWGSTDRPFKKGRHPHLFGWKLCSQARKILWHACFSRHRPWLNFKSLVYLEHSGQVGQAKDLRQTNGFWLRPMPALTQLARRSPHV